MGVLTCACSYWETEAKELQDSGDHKSVGGAPLCCGTCLAQVRLGSLPCTDPKKWDHLGCGRVSHA